MSTTAEALLAAGAMTAAARWRPHNRLLVWVPVGLVWFPLPTLLITAVRWVAVRLRAAARARHEEAQAVEDVLALGELSLLGLSAGLSFSQSLRLAAEPLGDLVRADVDRVLRSARLVGLPAALAAAEGRCARLFALASRSVDSGSPVSGAVEAFVDDAVADRRERSLTAARRLPIKLLFPLALLILPGFMILTVGPALLGSLEKLTL